MAADQQPVIELAIEDPRTLGDIQKWAALADGFGIPTSSIVVMAVGGRRLAVRAFIHKTEAPVEG